MRWSALAVPVVGLAGLLGSLWGAWPLPLEVTLRTGRLVPPAPSAGCPPIETVTTLRAGPRQMVPLGEAGLALLTVVVDRAGPGALEAVAVGDGQSPERYGILGWEAGARTPPVLLLPGTTDVLLTALGGLLPAGGRLRVTLHPLGGPPCTPSA